MFCNLTNLLTVHILCLLSNKHSQAANRDLLTFKWTMYRIRSIHRRRDRKNGWIKRNAYLCTELFHKQTRALYIHTHIYISVCVCVISMYTMNVHNIRSSCLLIFHYRLVIFDRTVTTTIGFVMTLIIIIIYELGYAI